MLKHLGLLFCITLFHRPVTAWAGVRHFTFLYEAPTSAPGSFDFENSVTWKRTTDPNQSNQVDSVGSAGFGSIRAANDPRIGQLALKILW